MPPRRPPDLPGAKSSEHDTHLSAEERTAIDELLRRGIPEPEETTVSGPAVRGAGEPIILRFDLVGGGAHRGDDLPGLQLVHERYANELGSGFRRAVGDEGMLLAEPIGYAKFAEIYARMTAPTVILIANLVGVGCSVLISMEPSLALHFVDLLMGGEGGTVQLSGDPMTRGLTQAEKSVLQHVVAIMSRALNAAWVDVAPVELELQRIATDPRNAAIYEPSEPMVEMSLRVEWGDVYGAIRMSMPTAFLSQYDHVLSRTATPRGVLKKEGAHVEAMRSNLRPVEVSVSAILGQTEMTLERLLSLAPGEVLRLDADPEQPVVVCVEGIRKMRAYPTVQQGNVALRISDFIDELSHPGAGDGLSTK